MVCGSTKDSGQLKAATMLQAIVACSAGETNSATIDRRSACSTSAQRSAKKEDRGTNCLHNFEVAMRRTTGIVLLIFAGLTALARADEPALKVGEKLARRGDEIMVCGQLYHTTTRVVLWTDPGGYDAYRVEPRFAPLDQVPEKATDAAKARRPSRFRLRSAKLSPAEIERVRGGGWDLALLSSVVDQFVIHFDARGTSRGCFQVLQDVRGLSVHFMLDLDGTIYQTLDVKEGAHHATIANGRSIGIEIANIGAYAADGASPLERWYQADEHGRVRIVPPAADLAADRSLASKRLHPARDSLVVGTVQQQRLKQYDFTPEQYEALARLTATLCTLFPKIRCDYPRDAAGALVTHKLPDPEYAAYEGILGHYHVQTNKVDPGPAFQWDRLIESTKKLMKR
jgi:N-acetylmuramoyl-L-alanine amidase